jgi:hypothetical protein
MLCPAGAYCPDPKTIVNCPQGHWCPTGSLQPLSCPEFSHCPEGSWVPFYYGPVVYAIIIDIIVLLAAFLFYKHERRLQRQVALTLTERDEMESDSKSDPNLDVIMEAFKKSFKGMGNVLNVSFRFEELGLTLPSRVSILDGVTGTIPSRSLTAIMGPSGGKLS